MGIELNAVARAQTRGTRRHALLTAMREGICVVDTQGRLLEVSDRMCELTGFSRDELVGSTAPFPFWPDDQTAGLTEMLHVALARRSGHFEVMLRRGDDTSFPALVHVAEVTDVDGSDGILCVVHDITAQVSARDEAEFRARLLDEIDAAVIATDAEAIVTHWNDAAERLYGWSREEAVGRPAAELTVRPGDGPLAEEIRETVLRAGRWEGEVVTYRKDGTSFPAHVRNVTIEDADGEVIGLLGVSVDISEQVKVERELRSARDHLHAVTASMGEGLCTVDTDGYVDFINPAAERMLGWTLDELRGRRFHETMHFRHADGSLYLPAESPLVRARADGRLVRVHDDMFVRKDGSELPVAYTSAPIEMADGVTGSVIVFSDITERKRREERMERDREALTWLTRIREALERDRFKLYAQPIIDLATGVTVQHELLIRMLDDDGKLIPPGMFLPVAEQYGSIREIDRWVIHQAAELAGAGHAVELNLSAESLGDPGLFTFVERELADAGANPSRVVIELTETALLRDDGAAEEFITRVADLGCGVALDDFGTGYGGFTYVKRLPVDYLKIDIEFVRDLPRDAGSQNVARAIVQLAKDFGQKTVAEGVEDDETLAMLRDLGVDYAQGYGIGRPVPLEQTTLTRRLRVA